MKTTQLAELTVEQLHNKLADNHTELANLRFQKALQQLEAPARIPAIKTEIAQIKTRLREYELEIRSSEGK
jgi:large subunit ribosomal protein L29